MADCIPEKSSVLTFHHGFSNRLGGVSTGIYESLNLGWKRGDLTENVEENWRRFLGACEMDGARVCYANQVHGTYVHIATAKDGREPKELPCGLSADGFVTNEKNLALAVTTADCIPLLLEDAKNEIIGAVHCGWRGVVADIEKEAILKMVDLGAEIPEIHAALGPAIDLCCFEVGPEVVEAVKRLLENGNETDGDITTSVQGTALWEKRGEKYMLDLRATLERRLVQLGVLPENIEKVGGCTMCHPEKYFSHRYTGGKRGSQYGIIMMK